MYFFFVSNPGSYWNVAFDAILLISFYLLYSEAARFQNAGYKWSTSN